jgi:alpha-L-rhamnosidase
MKTIFQLLVLIFLTNACVQKSEVNIINLKCEYKVNPLGVDIVKPRFSWNLESEQRGVNQTAYQLLVASSLENLNDDQGDIWDSKRIASDESIQIYFNGNQLGSDRKYFWKVKVWDQDKLAHTSEPAFWTTGLFHESDWKAKWIGLDQAVGDDDPVTSHRKLSSRMLRHEFDVEKKISSANAFVSGLGLFEMYINGEKIGDQVLAPGLTEYDKRTFYMTFDLTDKLQSNKNTVGIILGNGRYFAPRNNEPTATKTYGYPKAICQINILYEDGSTKTIKTDESWRLTTKGPTRKNNEFDGEFYDARMELDSWNLIGYDDSDWISAKIVDKPGEKLVGQPSEPIKIMEELDPIDVNEVKPGVFIFDMGQNMVGWTELFVNGKAGDEVTLRFAETVNEDGTLFLDNIRGAEVTDTYILKGTGNESWEPKFTYHGFRFVEMIGFPGKPTLNSIKGKVVYDAVETTGSFDCSNPLINSIYKNAYWGIRGNYRSMPTDCPQRDERQGWLGDRSAECTGESYIFDISKLYNKWVTDMNDGQLESGSISDVAPSYWPLYTDNTTWPGTFLFASDMLYTQYGDLKTIETNYASMQKWIRHMSQYLSNGIMTKDTYGDWCVPPEDVKLIHTGDPLRITSSQFIGTAYFYYELRLMAKFAKLLGKEIDAEQYAKKAEMMKSAFNNKFLDKLEIKYSNNTHTANILALAFDLVPKEYRNRILDNLLQKILAESDGHVGNGIIGGQWLMRTLTNNEHEDVAYTLVTQNTYPSWGYMVEKGATTIWELWNGDEGDPGMNSGNHVMLLGDLIIWFYENLAGIKADPKIPAFKHIIMKPYVLGDLTYVDASYESSYGKIISKWKLEKDKFNWKISIPANTTATIYVPTLNKEDVLEEGKSASNTEGIEFLGWEENKAIFKIESGNYTFTSKGATRKITKGYVSTPVISPNKKIIMTGDKILVDVTCKDEEAVIRYTTDKSLVSESSPVYRAPFEISANTVVRAQAFEKGRNPSNQTKVIYNFVDPTKNGIEYALYRGEFVNLPDFNKLKPVAKGKVFQFELDKIDVPKNNFAIQYSSYLQINKEGNYEFTTSSNDGSKLYIDDKPLVDNDGEHGAKEMSASKFLSKAKHAIRVEYFQSGGSKALEVKYGSAEITDQAIPGSVLFTSKN